MRGLGRGEGISYVRLRHPLFFCRLHDCFILQIDKAAAMSIWSHMQRGFGFRIGSRVADLMLRAFGVR